MDYLLFDGLALGDVLGDGSNPKPFRLFAVGKNELTQNGKPYVLTLSAEQIRSIADYHAKKGEKIPIDSRHALFLSAEKAGITETDAVKAVPGGVAALGFAALEAREDGLYASEIELLPEYDYFLINDDLDEAIGTARAIMKAEHCKTAGTSQALIDKYKEER